jgi:hypothetical protein
MNVDSSLAIRIECLSCVVFDEKDERQPGSEPQSGGEYKVKPPE